MSLVFKNIDIVPIIEATVNSIRETGSIDSAIFDGTNTTFTVANSLSKNDVIYLDGNDKPKRVVTASATEFVIKEDYSSATTYKSAEPYFYAGHILEIANIISARDKSTGNYKFQKYPAVFLILDTESIYNPLFNTFDYDNLRLIIVNRTNPKYRTEDRRFNSFEPILWPIYENLITAIRKSKSIKNDSSIPFVPHTKTDRYFWGTELNTNSTKNIMNDFLDAVEIKNLKLSVKNLNC